MAKPRTVYGLFVVVTLAIAVCIVLRTFRWQPGLLALRPSNKSMETSNVLIVAHSRSGSSFLGQIFNSCTKVFYVYEPLITFQVTTMRDSKLYEQSAKRLLGDIFNCRFIQQTEFLSFMSHMPLNRFSSYALTTPYCKNTTRAKDNRTFVHCKDLDPLMTSLSCTLHKHVVIKVLIHRLLPFLDEDYLATLFNSSVNLKIIHLTRDPRAVIASLDRVGWSFNKSVVKAASTDFPLFATLAQKQCSEMIQSLSLGLSAEQKFPDRYKIVRYEDLVRSPLHVSQELLDFSGIPMSAQVEKYLINHTGTYDRRNTHEYGTVRNNISALIDSWRRRLTLQAVQTIESHCWPILDILRYTPVYSQSLLKT